MASPVLHPVRHYLNTGLGVGSWLVTRDHKRIALMYLTAVTFFFFVGFNLTFFPQFIVGYLGMPRRYHAYPPEFQVLNVLSSAGASILGVGYLIPMAYLAWSLRYGKYVGSNPWGAVGLEWTTTSPPPTENFAETPIVTWDAYDYPTKVGGHVV